MGYGLNTANLNAFLYPVDESFSTMGRQIMDDIKHLFNGENWTDNDASAANYLKAKRKYFDELFTLSPQLKSKLARWISRIPGALIMSHSTLSQMLSGTTTEKETITTHDPNGGAYTHTIDVRQRNELALQQKARVNNGRNSMTYATCSYILDMGNKAALLFFTFDSDGIDVCQVLTKNPYSTGGRSSGYDIAKVPEWRSVNKSEYMK